MDNESGDGRWRDVSLVVFFLLAPSFPPFFASAVTLSLFVVAPTRTPPCRHSSSLSLPTGESVSFATRSLREERQRSNELISSFVCCAKLEERGGETGIYKLGGGRGRGIKQRRGYSYKGNDKETGENKQASNEDPGVEEDGQGLLLGVRVVADEVAVVVVVVLEEVGAAKEET